MKCNAEPVRDRVQAQPIIRKHGLIEGLAPARPDGGKHECVLPGRPALSTSFVDGPAHCFRNRDPAVIGTPIAVLAFDLFRLKLSAPSRVHDLKRRALVNGYRGFKSHPLRQTFKYIDLRRWLPRVATRFQAARAIDL
jgi:hypothetical protein